MTASKGDGGERFEDVIQFNTSVPTPLARAVPKTDKAPQADLETGLASQRVSDPRPAYRRPLRTTSAVALGGLAGNNAHGAGFLHALHTTGIWPRMITCTSGQILWTYRFLKADNLRAKLDEDIRAQQPFGPRLDWNVASLIGGNEKQRIRLAVPEYWHDLARASLTSWMSFWKAPFEYSVLREAMGVWPARSLVNQDEDKLYEDMATYFNREEIGIAFNAFDFSKGLEIVYLNDAAADLTGKAVPSLNSSRPWTLYQPITATAIRNALWLYEYGFEDCRGALDGAYFRDIMLSEIPDPRNDIDVIAVVRPLSDAWSGGPPRNWVEMRDLQTEVSFNGTYFGERQRIRDMNNDIAKTGGEARQGERKQIRLAELPLQQQRGWWDYIFESRAVFDSAFERGVALARYL